MPKDGLGFQHFVVYYSISHGFLGIEHLKNRLNLLEILSKCTLQNVVSLFLPF